MPIPQKIFSLLKYVGRNFESAVKDSVSGLKFLALLPFRDLARVRKKNVSTKERLQGLVLLPFKLVLAAVSVFIRVVISPAELGVNLFNREIERHSLDDPVDHWVRVIVRLSDAQLVQPRR